jgi:hypothetical protein
MKFSYIPQFHTLPKAVAATIAWFDRLGIAVTVAEIQRFLWKHNEEREYTYGQIVDGINEAQKQGCIQCVRHWCVLPHRNIDEYIKARYRRHLHMGKKWWRAQRFVRYARWIPGIRCIAVANDGGWGLASVHGDIDLFIITHKAMTWWTRGLCLLLSWVQGSHGRQIKEHLCLSFTMSDEKLSLEHLCIEDGDPYLAYWCMALYPLVDDGVYEHFINAQSWLSHYFRLPQPVVPSDPPVLKPGCTSSWKVPLFIESFFMKIQKLRLEKLYKNNKNANIISSPSMIKVHLNDARMKIKNEWYRALQGL